MSTDPDVNYYDILHVPHDASYEEIQVAYDKVISEFFIHGMPFTEVDQAYNVLSNKDTRSAYDRELETKNPGGKHASSSVAPDKEKYLTKIDRWAGLVLDQDDLTSQREDSATLSATPERVKREVDIELATLMLLVVDFPIILIVELIALGDLYSEASARLGHTEVHHPVRHYLEHQIGALFHFIFSPDTWSRIIP